MTERKQNIVIGITTLVGGAALIGLIMSLGYLPKFLESGYVVTVHLPKSGGLHQGSRVKFSGIDIGQVESVELSTPPKPGVVVKTLINSDVRIPVEAEAAAKSPVFGGGAKLRFYVEGPLTQPTTMLATNGSAEVLGETSSLASTFTKQLHQALKEPMQNFDRLTRKFIQFSDEWTRVGDNVNKLIAVRAPSDVDAGKATANLSTVLVRTDRRLAEMKQVLAGVNRYANDEQLHRNIAQTAANARKLSTTAAAAVTRLQKRYMAVADDFSGLIGQVNKTVAKANHAKGTLGKLLSDPSLYDNLNDTVERLKKAVDDGRLLIQKWKAEGLPVQF